MTASRGPAPPDKATAAPSTSTAAPTDKHPSPAEAGREPADVRETVGKLNEYMQLVRRELRFTVDDTTGETVISVIDAETDEVVRKIPSDEVLEVVRHFEGNGRSLMVGVHA